MNDTNSLNLATEINAARKGMICDQGHFHPDMSPGSVLMGVLSLFLHAELHGRWESPAVRNTMVTMIAQLAQETREYIKEVSEGEITTEELMELLDAPDEQSLTVVARCIGMSPTIRNLGTERVH